MSGIIKFSLRIPKDSTFSKSQSRFIITKGYEGMERQGNEGRKEGGMERVRGRNNGRTEGMKEEMEGGRERWSE